MRDSAGSSTEFANVLAREVATGAPVALLDFPWHNNPGDAAIWLGENFALSKLGHTIVYPATAASLDPRRLRSVLPSESPILLHGGGNFGDLWPDLHAHRMQVIRSFPDRRIVQLPQTVHFRDPEFGADSLAEIADHQNFLAMARDANSFDTLQRAGIETVLSDDASTALPLDRSGFGEVAIGNGPLVLMRKDSERTLKVPEVLGTGTKDWSDFDIVGRATGLAHILDRTLDAMDRIEDLLPHGSPWSGRPRAIRFRRFSNRLVRRALSVIRSHEFVVTDRLHGVLLALACDRPVLAIDSGYGKLDSYIDTFLGDDDRLHRISDPVDIDGIDAILAELRDRSRQ